MAKDPAVLWYFNDWQGGTSTLSRHLKGCYMDLLHAQFNNGHLSMDEIKTVLGSDFGQAWPTLQKKFNKDESTGLYYNEKLILERDRRRNYSESRRGNLKSSKSFQPHMGAHMETEIENVIKNIPTNWNKDEFKVLLKKWIEKRKNKPDGNLLQLRVGELVANFPDWLDARAAITEAAAEGWQKIVYANSLGHQPNKPKSAFNELRPDGPRDKA